MKCDIIKQTIFFARDKKGKEYIIKNDHFSKYEEVVHEGVEGVCSEEDQWIDDKSYMVIPYFEIKEELEQ